MVRKNLPLSLDLLGEWGLHAGGAVSADLIVLALPDGLLQSEVHVSTAGSNALRKTEGTSPPMEEAAQASQRKLFPGSMFERCSRWRLACLHPNPGELLPFRTPRRGDTNARISRSEWRRREDRSSSHDDDDEEEEEEEGRGWSRSPQRATDRRRLKSQSAPWLLVLLLPFLPFSVWGVNPHLFVIFLQRCQILARLSKLTLLHALAYVPVYKCSLGVHQVELVVQSCPGLCDRCGVAQHADGPLNLGQVSTGHHSGWLVVDADLRKESR
ncbi:hypothetical protein DNTS_007213 [Danionella cerebrum]|uniref:Uncharacterized protein n=1 Tax=Danionella cerebrum TaxID=2873325 RepID=A0A553PIQ6_9TELE|nr:hypothetical protein DNTS_007213 [Danionella translucida]